MASGGDGFLSPLLADEEDEVPSCLWTPMRNVDGPSLPEPNPPDLRGVFHAPTSPPSPPASPPSVPPVAAFGGLSRASPPSSAPTPSGKPTVGAEVSVFEQRLLDSHERQGALLSSWYQQQGALMTQQNLLLQRLADGIEALSHTLERLVEVAHPGQGVSLSTSESAVARGSQASPQGAPEVFSGMILKVEEEI